MSLMPDVRDLVSQHLEVHNICKMGEGWDSAAYLVNGDVVVRIPKRPEAAQRMQHEIRVLRLIHRERRVAAPEVTLVGPQMGEAVISFVGYPLIKGRPLRSNGCAEVSVLADVAQCISELHGIPYEVLRQSNVQWFRWTGTGGDEPLHGWASGLRAFADIIAERVYPLLKEDMQGQVQSHLDGFLAAPEHFTFTPALIHGDLSAEHIIVDPETGRFNGIIDFGDSGLGDPAYDVRPEMLPYYGRSIDPSFATRNRFYRSLAPFHTVLYGLEIGDEGTVAAGVKAVQAMFRPGGGPHAAPL